MLPPTKWRLFIGLFSTAITCILLIQLWLIQTPFGGLTSYSELKNLPNAATLTGEKPDNEDLYGPKSILSDWKLIESAQHNPTCFTQGLEFLNSTHLYESCGSQTNSKLLLWYMEEKKDGRNLKQLNEFRIPRGYFAEGLTFLGDSMMYMLTWREYQFMKLDISKDFYSNRQFHPYPFHGWGIAYDKFKNLMYTTNGSQYINILQFDPTNDNVEFIGSKAILCDGNPLYYMNEMEFVAETKIIYLNVLDDPSLYAINSINFECIARFDMTEIAIHEFGPLNGIALDPLTDTFWVTGKNWKWIHRIKLLDSFNKKIQQATPDLE